MDKIPDFGAGKTPIRPGRAGAEHLERYRTLFQYATMNEIAISVAGSPEDLDQVRLLIRQFVAWHLERHQQDRHLINAYFDQAAFEAELAGLPGKYKEPGGALLLAKLAGEAAGCVAFRSLDSTTAEMKRMFVYERFQGRGVGKALALAIVETARQAGFKTMRLDTSFRQVEALSLYERIGFERMGPYYELPEAMKEWLVFMEKKL